MLGAMLGSTGVRAAAVGEPASCRTVHLADVGWTDVTATTAVLGMGVEAGFVIVLLAVILDRVMRIRQRRP